MSERVKQLIDKLEKNNILSREEFICILEEYDTEDLEYARSRGRSIAKEHFGNAVYVRGLIEFTNYCKNDCLYCGIRKSNKNAERYRLTEDEIMECCKEGYALGFRTFVLQGGEDGYYTKDRLVALIQRIKAKYPDCALTLSIGEKTKEEYQSYFDAGADRYLLRHETANEEHYNKLHPASMSLANRKECLKNLKEIGYQTGCGFMVGSPYQTAETLAQDLLYIHDLHPQMVGIGPFISHKETPFCEAPNGELEPVLLLLSLIRIMEKKVLLPATTALATIHPQGRELGILSGANVVMPNLSPVSVRKKYELYDNKVCTGDEAAECRNCLQARMKNIGYEIVKDRGDYKK
ncbi:MAG: [FeFe] hydrogenase H-cluster radical SAM maturase HydE [Lachnospiraceae bacterium]|nr:[FeFe] hydrogenase H-cluster radical SAM maturase HydE [Lachnospiraceae bacterium]